MSTSGQAIELSARSTVIHCIYWWQCGGLADGTVENPNTTARYVAACVIRVDYLEDGLSRRESVINHVDNSRREWIWLRVTDLTKPQSRRRQILYCAAAIAHWVAYGDSSTDVASSLWWRIENTSTFISDRWQQARSPPARRSGERCELPRTPGRRKAFFHYVRSARLPLAHLVLTY